MARRPLSPSSSRPIGAPSHYRVPLYGPSAYHPGYGSMYRGPYGNATVPAPAKRGNTPLHYAALALLLWYAGTLVVPVLEQASVVGRRNRFAREYRAAMTGHDAELASGLRVAAPRSGSRPGPRAKAAYERRVRAAIHTAYLREADLSLRVDALPDAPGAAAVHAATRRYVRAHRDWLREYETAYARGDRAAARALRAALPRRIGAPQRALIREVVAFDARTRELAPAKRA